MNFNEQVMQCEFDKAERMLKRAKKLIKKATIPIEDRQSVEKQRVKFSLPQIC